MGTMPGGTTLESVYEQIAAKAPEIEAVDVQIISSDRDAAYLAVFCLRQEEAQVEEVLRSGGFSRPAQSVGMIPEEAKESLEEEIQKLKSEIADTEDVIRGYKGGREKMCIRDRRKTQASTPLFKGSSAKPCPLRNITPAIADCRFKVPLTPRLHETLFYCIFAEMSTGSGKVWRKHGRKIRSKYNGKKED